MRVETNPAALLKYGIGLEDVRAAINANNANRPKGVVEDGEHSWQIYSNDQSKSASEYLPIVIAYKNGAAVRLNDVAEVVDSVQDLRNFGSANGKISSSISRWSSEYRGCSDVSGAIAWDRIIWLALKLETPMLRTLPSSLSLAMVAQPSSISSSGMGQWTW